MWGFLVATKTSSRREIVEQRVLAGLCLGENVDGTQCDRPSVKRGLCCKCHMTWYRTCREKSKEEAAAYTKRLVNFVATCWVLASFAREAE
jgi:hypothetical protein